MPSAYPILGASMALAGASKLAGERSYRKLVSDLHWTDQEMRRIGAAEVVGGALVLFRPTRRLGAAIVIAASATVLAAEVKRRDYRLAGPRAGLLLTAIGALVAP